MEDVITLGQGHDPTVQYFAGGHSLSSKIVNQQRAAIALHLYRSFANTCRGTVTHLKAVQRQFAAHNKGRATNSNPPFIDVGQAMQLFRGHWQRLMVVGVVKLHDVPTHVECSRNPDRLAKGTCQPTSNGGFSIAWGSVQEHPQAGVHGLGESQ